MQTMNNTLYTPNRKNEPPAISLTNEWAPFFDRKLTPSLTMIHYRVSTSFYLQALRVNLIHVSPSDESTASSKDDRLPFKQIDWDDNR